MKKSRIKSLIVVGFVSACFCLGILNNRAFAGTNTMTVSPPHQKIILIPGETYNGSITVFNASSSEKPLSYRVEVGSFSQQKGENDDAKDDYGAMDHISRSSYNQIVDWIKLDKEKGTVEPGVAEDVTFKIEVPKNAPGGGQYATLLVVDDTASGAAGGGGGNVEINQTFQFASIIYAEVAGKTEEKGEILDNTMPSFLLNGPLTAESMVKNNGNVHTDAEYTFQVWPLFGNEEICTNEEKPETSLVLPETERYHAQTCEDMPSIGIFKAKQVVKIFGETSVVERTVIICPLWLLFLILFIIIAIVIWIVMKVRGSKKRSRKSSDE